MNYGNLPARYSGLKSSKVVIVPVPYDGTSTWGKGADKGPAALLDASANMELYDIETDSEPYTIGIHTDKPLLYKTPEKGAKVTEEKVGAFLDQGKLVCLLGGEHSVSAGAIAAAAKRFKKMSVLQLDAHSDMREEYNGSRYNHACVMARAKDLCPVVQVGIRSMDSCEKPNIKKDRVFFAENIRTRKNWIREVVAKLTDEVYITIDLDVFDPSVLPSTGTPEPGGLGWYEVLDLLREVIRQKKMVAFDVVELAPNPKEKASDFLAAKLIYKMLAYRYF
ncbi:MAG: agmatinase [Candidatus Gracilibacteria bacterium]